MHAIKTVNTAQKTQGRRDQLPLAPAFVDDDIHPLEQRIVEHGVPPLFLARDKAGIERDGGFGGGESYLRGRVCWRDL